MPEDLVQGVKEDPLHLFAVLVVALGERQKIVNINIDVGQRLLGPTAGSTRWRWECSWGRPGGRQCEWDVSGG